MSWSLPQSVVPDFGATIDGVQRYKQNALAEMLTRRKLTQQEAYEQALQSNVGALGSNDPNTYRNALAALAQSGAQGAETALPLLQKEREQALIGSILGGGVGGQMGQPVAPTPQPSGGAAPQGGSWMDTLQQQESGGNPAAKNPRSSATGSFQFIDSTWLKFAEANPNLFQGMNRDQILAARANPGLQRMGAEWYAKENAGALQQAGYQPTPINLALSHRFGPGGAVALLGAKPGTNAADVLGPDVIQSNPDLRGKSAGSIVAGFAGHYGNSQGRDMEAPIGQAPGQGQSQPPQQPQAPQQAGGQDVMAMRQRANQLRLISNPGAQAAAASLDQQANALEARQAQQQQTQLALQARREDMETRRNERVEDRANSNPAFGNSLEGRALGIVQNLAGKVADGSATDDELKQYDTAVTAYQETKTMPDGTRITPRLPAYAPGADVVQRLYEQRRGGQQQASAAPTVAPQTNLPTAGGGIQEGTKPIPQAMQTAMMSNADGVGKIDRALAKVDAAPGAFGAVAGALNMVPGGLQDRYAPQSSVEARAAIADIGSLVLHDRSGAAVTASEFPRLQPFIPSVSDSPETVKTKLRRFRQEYLAELRNQYDVFGPSQGFKPNPVVERALGDTGGGAASTQQQAAVADPAGILGRR